MAERNDHRLSGLRRQAQTAITVRMRFVARLAKGRKGLILAVVALSVFALIALYWARYADQYMGNLLLNIGASFVGAVFTYALIEPLMSRVESREEKILDNFDHANVIQHINDTKNIVRIFDTGVELLNEKYQARFLAACRAALNGGVQVEILLLDPDCLAAVQRAEELGTKLDIRSLISENLYHLHKFHADLNQSAQLRFEVRVYATSPLASYYRWDRRALVSFFPTDRSSVDTTQYETSVDSNFAQFIEQRFHESWQAPNTHTLELHFALPITVMRDGRERQSLLADWVVLEGQVYLAHRELIKHALESGLGQLQVHLDHVVPLAKPLAGACGLAVCDTNSPAHLALNRKYGPEKREVFSLVTDTSPLSA